VPLWRGLAAAGVPLEVWFLTNHGLVASHDREFGERFAWDVDMLSGYASRFLEIEPGWDLSRFRDVRLRERLADRLRREGVRALWIEGWRFQANWQALRAARAVGVEVWLRGESNDLKRDGRLKALVKRPLLGRFFDRVDEFLCIGAANRRLYESYGVSRGKLHAAPYCVDNERFASAAKKFQSERDRIRDGWKIPRDSFCVLFCGKFIAKKRPLDLVHAVTRLGLPIGGSGPVHLLFVGSGQLGAEVRGACSVVFDAEGGPVASTSDKAKPASSFVGFMNQSQIARAYAAADLLVLPSDSGETWGLVANEAMACGVPAVVSDLCGCGEDLVAPLDRRLVFPFGDVDGLAAAIRHAMVARIPGEQIQRAADTHHLRHTVETAVTLYESRCDH
jgi:glycosyltransferase involved in cell wall biosynthesis